MEEILSITLREGDAETLLRAAELMDRLEAEHPNDVLFDSNDQYYVSLKSAAQRFRLLSGVPHQFKRNTDMGMSQICAICGEAHQ